MWSAVNGADAFDQESFVALQYCALFIIVSKHECSPRRSRRSTAIATDIMRTTLA